MILGVTEILCSPRLVLERKRGKKLLESSRLGFLEKHLARNFALSDADKNTSGTLNRGGITDSVNFLGSDRLFCFISCSKNFSSMITILFKLYFRFKGFILLVQTKTVISTSYGSSISSWKLMR